MLHEVLLGPRSRLPIILIEIVNAVGGVAKAVDPTKLSRKKKRTAKDVSLKPTCNPPKKKYSTNADSTKGHPRNFEVVLSSVEGKKRIEYVDAVLGM